MTQHWKSFCRNAGAISLIFTMLTTTLGGLWAVYTHFASDGAAAAAPTVEVRVARPTEAPDPEPAIAAHQPYDEPAPYDEPDPYYEPDPEDYDEDLDEDPYEMAPMLPPPSGYGLVYATPPAAYGPGATPATDVETMQLERMIDDRSRRFDALRQIVDRYNATAKGIIDSMGR